MNGKTAIPDHIVRAMRARGAARTDEALQQEFGISYNTWRRIDKGEAIRASVAARLIERLAAH